MLKHLVFIWVLALFLTSCSRTFYQVYTVSAPEFQKNNNALTRETKDYKITYNLWEEGGTTSFIFENKTDRDIYIDKTACFVLRNGLAEDYYKGRTFQETVSIAKTSEVNTSEIASGFAQLFGAIMGYNASVGYNNSKTNGGSKSRSVVNASSVEWDEKRIECIPAKSFKVIKGQEFTYLLKKFEDKNDVYPKHKEISKKVSYDKDKSPLVLINRLTYSFDRDGNHPKMINDEFWISSICNYSHDAAKENVNKGTRYEALWKFKIGGPDMFYNIYKNK